MNKKASSKKNDLFFFVISCLPIVTILSLLFQVQDPETSIFGYRKPFGLFEYFEAFVGIAILLLSLAVFVIAGNRLLRSVFHK